MSGRIVLNSALEAFGTHLDSTLCYIHVLQKLREYLNNTLLFFPKNCSIILLSFMCDLVAMRGINNAFS
jgi:hypothetical protein